MEKWFIRSQVPTQVRVHLLPGLEKRYSIKAPKAKQCHHYASPIAHDILKRRYEGTKDIGRGPGRGWQAISAQKAQCQVGSAAR